MATITDSPPIEFTEFHLFAGLGGGSLGASLSRVSYMGVQGTIRSIGAIDSDALACEDYRNFTGSPITCMDLFDRAQYEAFHGHEPPDGWREATPADIRAAAGGGCPDIVFTSPPCKGFSGLLPNKSAESAKYQALNRLTVRSIRLTLEAFNDAPPRIILFENVPRIRTRGADLLKEIKSLLRQHGYACHDADHDCGEIGGLAQHRKRYLLIARHTTRCRPFVYQPPVRDLKTIGDVIGPLPLPDDPAMGPMHRLPRLKWLTWLRLALIPAGGDWRDLQKIAPEEYRLERGEWGTTGGPYTVQDWDEPGATITGSARITGSSPAALADPRVTERSRRNSFVVRGWGDRALTIVGEDTVGSGAQSVGGPRLSMQGESYSGSPGLYGVNEWEGPAPAVTGSASVSSSNTPAAIADPRLKDSESRHSNKFRVSSHDEPAPCVTGTRFGSGALAISDPRLPESGGVYPGRFGVRGWGSRAGCITGDTDVQCGAQSIGDPRLAHAPRPGVYRILRMDEASGAVVGGAGVGVSNGPQAVADSRLGTAPRSGYMRVMGMREISPTIVGSGRVTGSNGPSVVADHRLGCSCRNGSYGVMGWAETASAIVGAADCHAAKAAIADVRLPANNDRLDPPPVIVALDGTWHRPLTTLELLALQSFPLFFRDGRPVVLAGKSDGKWRERIGNAVPPEASRRMHEQIVMALLQNELGETFMLGSTQIWVTPEEQPGKTARRELSTRRGTK